MQDAGETEAQKVGGEQKPRRLVLNTGCGLFNPDALHTSFARDAWEEVRLDINPLVKPDIVGSITDMRDVVADGSYSAVWSSHNIEHLHAHQVLPALREFRRVLRNDGFALITCPDAAAVAFLVLEGLIETPAYMSPAGPITALDMIHGHAASIERGNVFMAHNTSFTVERLGRLALEAEFAEVRVAKGRDYDLWALALMPGADRTAIEAALGATEQAFLFG